MIADQERNVKQWWEDRVSLIKTQEMRIGKINDLNEVLYGHLILRASTYI